MYYSPNSSLLTFTYKTYIYICKHVQKTKRIVQANFKKAQLKMSGCLELFLVEWALQ